MNHVERISALLIAAGPAGATRSEVVGNLKANTAYRATSALEKAGLLSYVKGGNGGNAMYFAKPEYAAAHLELRRQESEKQRAAAKAAKVSAKPREKWRVLLDVLEESGRKGIERDDLAARAGVSQKSVRGMISWARKVTGTTAGMRIIDGREVYFSAKHRPKPVVRKPQGTERIMEVVTAAGAKGVRKSELKAIVSESSVDRYALLLRRQGKLHYARAGNGTDRIRYFCSSEFADACKQASKDASAAVRQARRASQRKTPVVRAKKTAKPVNPRVLVLPKGKPAPKLIYVEPTNPNNIKPVFVPTPPPRFHVEQVGRHINPAECRPWAMYA